MAPRARSCHRASEASRQIGERRRKDAILLHASLLFIVIVMVHVGVPPKPRERVESIYENSIASLIVTHTSSYRENATLFPDVMSHALRAAFLEAASTFSPIESRLLTLVLSFQRYGYLSMVANNRSASLQQELDCFRRDRIRSPFVVTISIVPTSDAIATHSEVTPKAARPTTAPLATRLIAKF